MYDDRLSDQENSMLEYWSAWLKAYAHFNPGATPSLGELMDIFVGNDSAENHALIQRYVALLEQRVRGTVYN